MSAIATALIGAVTKEGVARLSKTKAAVHVTGLNALLALAPGIMAKDPTAIGQAVVLLVTWGFTLWGRGNAG